MKLPRGAVRMGLRSAYTATAESDGQVGFTRWVAEPRDDGTLAAGPYDFETGWRATDGYVLKRQEARKLIRRLLSAVDAAEALEHGHRIARRAF